MGRAAWRGRVCSSELDAKGCTTTATAVITQPAAALAALITGQNNVSCFGGTDGSADGKSGVEGKSLLVGARREGLHHDGDGGDHAAGGGVGGLDHGPE